MRSIYDAASDRDHQDQHDELAEPSIIVSERDACVGCGADASHSEIDDDRPVRLCEECYHDACQRARRLAGMQKTKAERLIHLANLARLDGRNDEADVLVIRAKVASDAA